MAGKSAKGPLGDAFSCVYVWFLFPVGTLDATYLSLASFFIYLCLALGTIETEGAGCKMRPLMSKEQVKQAVKRVDVMQQNNIVSVLLSQRVTCSQMLNVS